MPEHDGNCCSRCMGDLEHGDWPLEDDDGNRVCCCQSRHYGE